MKRGKSGIRGIRAINLALCLALGGLLTGCAGGGGGTMVSSVGGNCKTLRKELSRLDSRGVPSLIEAKNAGRKVSAKKRKLIDRYNSVLDSYLSSKCHVKS